jgi:hypothetical protein
VTDELRERTDCAICRRPVWDEARPVELDDTILVAVVRVHRGCARRRARLERELELAARKGSAASLTTTERPSPGGAAPSPSASSALAEEGRQ